MNEASAVHVAWVNAALERYEAPLVRYAQRFTGDLEIARDVVQDTFLKLCGADRERIEAHLAPWLYRVCRNRALDVMKKEHRMQALTQEEAESRASGAAGPREQAESHETEAALLAALGRLPEEQQEVFRLKFLDQMSYQEISEITGASMNQVRYWIHTAMKTMRRRMRPVLDVETV